MQQHRGPAALQTLHQGDGPQRAGDVQRRLQHQLGQIEDVAQFARLGHPDPADMEVEVKVRIHHPAGRGGGKGRHDDLLP